MFLNVRIEEVDHIGLSPASLQNGQKELRRYLAKLIQLCKV